MATKKRIIHRVKTGLRGVPTDTFESMKYYFQMDVEKKSVSEILKTYIKSNYNKKDSTAILANPEYMFTMYTHFAAVAYWNTLKLDPTPKTELYTKGLVEYLDELKTSGADIVKQKITEEQLPTNVIQLNVRDRQQLKVGSTVYEDLYALEDKWHAGELATYDMFTAWKAHMLPTSSIQFIKPYIQSCYDELKSAYDKDDKQLVEGYSHLSRKELKHRVDQYKQMLDDLDRLKIATKAVRQTRVKKPKAIDKQIAKVQFKKEDNEFKIASINPVKIIGAQRLFTFNTKTRVIAEYVCNTTEGFEISGTSLKNIDSTQSRCTKLRKPELFLQIVMGKQPKAIGVEWAKLTTKSTEPNGRMNVDTVLLKVFDK